MSKSKLAFAAFIACGALGIFWYFNDRIEDTAYRPVALGLAATLGASLVVWPLSAWARSGWSVKAPEGLDFIEGGHDRPGPLMLGVLEAVVFYAAIVSAAWAVVGGWLVFKGASKWAAWQHIMQLPDQYGNDEAAYIRFRWGWSSRLLTSFLFGTLANVAVGFTGATVARVVAGISLVPLAGPAGS